MIAMMMLHCCYFDTELLSLWRHCEVIFWVGSMLRWGYADTVLLCMRMLLFMWFWCYSDVSLRFRLSWFELMICCSHTVFRLLWCYLGFIVMLFWCHLQGNVLCSYCIFEVVVRSSCGQFHVVFISLFLCDVDASLLLACCHANVILMLLWWDFEAWICYDVVAVMLRWSYSDVMTAFKIFWYLVHAVCAFSSVK